MSQVITITNEDILQQVKLSRKITELVEQIVKRKIITAAATEAGITVDTEELQETANKFRLINKLLSADETWTWLEKQGLSLDDFEEIVYYAVIYNKLSVHSFADKVEPYFYEYQLDYASAVIYEVVLDDEDLAMELFYAIAEKEMSFHDVAQQYIQDVELRRKGGYRGMVQRKEMKPEISAAVFVAKPPQILKPIVTSKGVHLIWVEEIIQPELDEKMRYQIIFNLFNEWLNIKVIEINTIINFDDKL
ncbi:peptidylprolyl isomerase [Coleofasciculus sp. FACHB-1120]|uniref:peptidylprolyl isomerase n=1 Tax=Coleofasciculus sp. FACHB-1120 TaxID=2692783 RepID=UPI00168961A2|nr:peptidylprolyl isomerase [Coleofasciculus sp. FACHB-1120]MBD2744713.1 peptidylprolyl isomerase [Coleofasciculus sp. FACHB-1120]